MGTPTRLAACFEAAVIIGVGLAPGFWVAVAEGFGEGFGDGEADGLGEADGEADTTSISGDPVPATVSAVSSWPSATDAGVGRATNATTAVAARTSSAAASIGVVLERLRT